MVILLGKEFSSTKWCCKCKLNPKVWLEHEHKIGENWAMNALRLVSESDFTGSTRLGVKEAPIWKFVEVDKYICPVLHNQTNLGNNVWYNLLNYGNEFIEKLTSTEIIIDAFINEKIILKQDFDISEDGNKLTSLKNVRRNNTPFIINATSSTQKLKLTS